MPMKVKIYLTNKPARFTLLVVCSALGAWVIYLDIQHVFSTLTSIVLSIAALAVLGLLVKFGIAPPPAGVAFPSMIGKRLSYLAKAAACGIASLGWVWMTVQVVSDTTTGAVLIGIPFMMFNLASLYFFFKVFHPFPLGLRNALKRLSVTPDASTSKDSSAARSGIGSLVGHLQVRGRFLLIGTLALGSIGLVGFAVVARNRVPQSFELWIYIGCAFLLGGYECSLLMWKFFFAPGKRFQR